MKNQTYERKNTKTEVQHEKNKSLNKHRKKEKNPPGKWHRLDIHQDHKKKFPQIKERYMHTDTRRTQNTKQTRSEKKLSMAYYNQNIKHAEQRQDTES